MEVRGFRRTRRFPAGLSPSRGVNGASSAGRGGTWANAPPSAVPPPPAVLSAPPSESAPSDAPPSSSSLVCRLLPSRRPPSRVPALLCVRATAAAAAAASGIEGPLSFGSSGSTVPAEGRAGGKMRGRVWEEGRKVAESHLVTP